MIRDWIGLLMGMGREEIKDNRQKKDLEPVLTRRGQYWTTRFKRDVGEVARAFLAENDWPLLLSTNFP